MKFTFIQCPLNKYTFSVKPIREWVESRCDGKVLNLFAGNTLLSVDEYRVDLDENMPADIHIDALDFIRQSNLIFGTILLDPPYSHRKSMEFYNGHKNSRFKQIKDLLSDKLCMNGKVITFGYHSISMGKNRGFELEEIAIFSHGCAIHDTIASVERKIG